MTDVKITAYTAKRVSPTLAAADMEQTLAFYQEVLGFSVFMKSAEYAILQRDGQTIHFMKAASQHVLDCARGHTEIYIEVSGIRELWIRELFEREYGMTEFHIDDPNGCLVFVGEPSRVRNRNS